MRSRKIVVTGSNGLLGQKMVKLLMAQEGIEVFALSRGPNRMARTEGYAYFDIDLSEEIMLRDLLESIRPDFLVHTAAMTNVDACELNKDECDRMNVEVVRALVNILKDIGTHLVHLSTDFVFSGLKGSPYTEEDPPDPVNYYGLSKLKSERIIEKSGIPHAILRTVLVYGLVDENDRSNVVLWVKNSLEQNKDINVVTDQLRMPTYAEDLAEACWLAIQAKASGVFNVSSSELISICDLAVLVAEAFGLDKGLIHPVGTYALNLPAKRPFSTGLDLSKSVRVLKLPLRSFASRLQDFKAQVLERDASAS
jgi:dTDP-4-dehydrorhamnose reductase